MFRNADYIYTVYKEKSFSRAAEKLYINQSSLSLTIKKAEERIGAPIFNRATNPISLTEFGIKYIEAVEKLYILQNDLNNALYDINHLNKGHLGIGAGHYFTNYFLPPYLHRYTLKYPHIKVNFYESSASNLQKMLDSGKIDFLLTHSQLDTAIYNKYTLAHTSLFLACPEELLPAAAQSYALTYEQLQDADACYASSLPSLQPFAETPFILLQSGNDTRIRCDQIFAAAAIQPPINFEVDQNASSYALAINGIGATIVSNLLILRRRPYQHMRYIALRNKVAEQDIYMYTHKNTLFTRAMEEFLNIIRETMPQYLQKQ